MRTAIVLVGLLMALAGCDDPQQPQQPPAEPYDWAAWYWLHVGSYRANSQTYSRFTYRQCSEVARRINRGYNFAAICIPAAKPEDHDHGPTP